MNTIIRSVLRLPDPPPSGGGNPPPPGGAPPPPGGTPPPAGGTPPPAGGTPPPPPPKPFYEGLYGSDGKIDKSALDRLPEHLKPAKAWLEKYDTIEAAITGGYTAHSLAVKKALAPLTGTEPPEVVAEHKALLNQLNGVPKDPKGYGITRPETLPEQFWNQEGADQFALLAQKHSISPAAVKELLALQVQMTQGEIDRGKAYETEYYYKQDQAYEAGVKKLGMDLEKANDMAARGAQTLGLDPKDPVFRNASVRLAAVRMTALVAEDKLITGDPTKGSGGAGDELTQARDIIGNPANPLHKAWADPNDPRHEAAKDKVNALYQQYGEKSLKRGGL